MKTTKVRQTKTFELLNQRQAAALLGINPRTFDRKLRSGAIPPEVEVIRSGHYRYSRLLLERLMAGELRRNGR